MDNQKFMELAKGLAANYANEHVDKTDGVQIDESQVFVVWLCKTLQKQQSTAQYHAAGWYVL